jgi:hypothetical protein
LYHHTTIGVDRVTTIVIILVACIAVSSAGPVAGWYALQQEHVLGPSASSFPNDKGAAYSITIGVEPHGWQKVEQWGAIITGEAKGINNITVVGLENPCDQWVLVVDTDGTLYGILLKMHGWDPRCGFYTASDVAGLVETEIRGYGTEGGTFKAYISGHTTAEGKGDLGEYGIPTIKYDIEGYGMLEIDLHTGKATWTVAEIVYAEMVDVDVVDWDDEGRPLAKHTYWTEEVDSITGNWRSDEFNMIARWGDGDFDIEAIG